MKKLLPLLLLATSCRAQSNPESLAGCDSPDAPVSCSFTGIPSAVSAQTVITRGDQGGESLVVSGRIINKDGKPLEGVALYVYHTDEKGIYSKTGKETGVQKWHGRYHGWIKTGADGKYSFETIRPGSYPNSNAPQHIHAAVKLPDGKTFWIGDFLFGDDPNLGKEAPPGRMPGGNGVMEVRKNDGGLWVAERDIIL